MLLKGAAVISRDDPSLPSLPSADLPAVIMITASKSSSKSILVKRARLLSGSQYNQADGLLLSRCLKDAHDKQRT
jgi:hypothetical protein